MAKKIDDIKLNSLLKLNKQLVLEDDFAKKIELISWALKDIIKADRCTIFIHDNTTKSLWSIYIDGISFLEVPDDAGIVSEVFKTKKTMVVNDAQNSPKFNSNIDKGSGYTTKSILSAPILGFGESRLGVIQLINKMDNNFAFNEEDEEVLNYVMSHISAFLEVMIQKD
ncbi:GAF domain-containing protein [Sulfurimonas sp. SAG-AH-194-I05]|nr:GAF domain-containing protein [Sulfurimonas sp. SAG-AH-194-I05]MDF1874119.1 GAF domain-containing protein [Sulfurimonas sp. SAG-AH-194-I05]